jgi:hypothetical protein
MVDAELDRLVKFLGPRRENFKGLLATASRSPDGSRIAKNVLRAWLRHAGANPDDLSAYPMIIELPAGVIRIGKVINGTAEGPVLALPEGTSSNVQHIGIFGLTRWGKTFLTRHIVRQHIENGGCAWIFDVDDEYATLLETVPETLRPVALLPRHLRLNLFEPPPGLGWKIWLDDVGLLLRQTVFLRDGSLNLFSAEMSRMIESRGVSSGCRSFPSLSETLEHFANLRFGGAKVRSATWLESLANRFQTIHTLFEGSAGITQSNMLRQLANRSVIFRLRELRGISLLFVTDFLITWIARHKESTPSAGMPLLIVIEEPHLLTADEHRLDIGKSVLPTLAATGGKRNIQLVLCNQLMSNLPPEILGNLGCRIVTRLANPRCIWMAQQSLGLTPEQAAQIQELEKREVIVQYADYPAAFKVRVDELSFPPPPDEAALESAAESFLAQVTWSEDSKVAEKALSGTIQDFPADAEGVTGDALKVHLHIAEHPSALIVERCDALSMDRAQEVRARTRLEAKGFLAPADERLGSKLRFYEITAKGAEWAERHGIKVKRFKSGPVHEYLLTEVEKVIGALSPRFRFQRHSEIAREHGLEPDSVLLLPGGQRIIIEICCNNMAFEAGSLIKETRIQGVDMVLAIAPSKRIKDSLARAVSKCRSGVAAEDSRPLVLLDAGECLNADFDWVALLERPT